MSMILIALLGLAAFLLILSLFKKLIKLAFTAVTLLLIVGGIWYVSQRSPEVAESLQHARGQAAEKFEEVAGKAMDHATDAMKDGAEKAVDRAAEAMKEGAEQAMEKAAEAMGDDGAGDGETGDGEAAKPADAG